MSDKYITSIKLTNTQTHRLLKHRKTADWILYGIGISYIWTSRQALLLLSWLLLNVLLLELSVHIGRTCLEMRPRRHQMGSSRRTSSRGTIFRFAGVASWTAPKMPLLHCDPISVCCSWSVITVVVVGTGPSVGWIGAFGHPICYTMMVDFYDAVGSSHNYTL